MTRGCFAERQPISTVLQRATQHYCTTCDTYTCKTLKVKVKVRTYSTS